MDTNTLPSTWQDALEKHPVSSVRTLEKELRASALRDREKLRALVGSDYRELLATAEQIVELNNQNREAEANISALSQACRPPSANHKSHAAPSRVATAYQLKFVDQLLRCTSMSTKDRSVSLASKALIISRLLLKHLDESNAPAKTVKWLQNRWRVLRQQLLRCIDSLLSRPFTSLAILTRAVGAYCLTTSSSAADAIKHFQSLRGHRLAQERPATTDRLVRLQELRQKCHYLIASVTATKAICGRGVVELLQNLQRQPLIEDEQVTQVETPQLDINSTLLPADVLSFMPYFTRSTPSASEMRVSVRVWVGDMMKHLAREVEAAVSDLNLIGVLRTRKQIFCILLPACFSASIGESGISLVREEFSKRIVQLLKQQAQHLHDIGSTLRSAQNDSPVELLWHTDVIRRMNAKMSASDLSSIRNLHLGAIGGLQALFSLLRKWLRRVQMTREELQNLTKMRWQDKIEEYDDDDEDTARTIISGLAKDEPESFLESLDSAAFGAAITFIATVNELSSETTKELSNIGRSTRVPTLLRLIREVRTVFQSLFPKENFPTLVASTRELEEALAQQTASEVFATIESSDFTNASSFVAEDLPSPVAVSVLRQICTVMAGTGGIDLWTKAAVRKLQRLVLKRIAANDKKAYYIRSDFDENYLQAALDGHEGSEQSTSDHQARKAAMYWNRTRTLFGALHV